MVERWFWKVSAPTLWSKHNQNHDVASKIQFQAHHFNEVLFGDTPDRYRCAETTLFRTSDEGSACHISTHIGLLFWCYRGIAYTSHQRIWNLRMLRHWRFLLRPLSEILQPRVAKNLGNSCTKGKKRTKSHKVQKWDHGKETILKHSKAIHSVHTTPLEVCGHFSIERVYNGSRQETCSSERRKLGSNLNDEQEQNHLRKKDHVNQRPNWNISITSKL